MKPLLLLPLVFVITVSLSGCTGTTAGPVAPAPKPPKMMKAFKSDDELKGYLRELAEKRKREAERRSATATGLFSTSEPSALKKESALPARADESVTNTQHAGVDEGDIVKLHGDHLVILRRGRLFTVAIGDGQLAPVSMVNAFGPEIDPQPS